ncbi:glycosyltransferase family 4 protein [Rhodothermus profundi]|uniref:Glycosyltransferase involved in cell wall bisynthesis n=1 Tax=Rhodothermus profundi TaxID=633813 RepID=A0A1M6SR28_9BACT|nr:glycosyltransferase family 4 protein [Rhodothermus profundi]SHK47145.1 Glycosyltransferase involved in cell wall bisynthesis [Rhodothermus profundi]
MEGARIRRVAFVGNYLPRQCGIATFTTDLCEAVAAAASELTCFAVPINDRTDGYAYPPRVRFEIPEEDLTAYRRAAEFLNINDVDVVCLQHEYGIFGGPAGSHVLTLVRELRMPVVTTLHTILREPDAEQRAVLEELAALSDRVVVMTQRGKEFLQSIYGVPESKIDLIPHGIPDVPFVDPNFYKDRFGVEGKIVLLTFGLLSRNKGIEYVIEALPAVLERHPHVVYIVLGATHPHVRQVEGESYRLFLQRRVRELGIEEHVIFHNRFVSLEELVEFIGAADIYLTPYLNREQITSGTLAYTVGCGKAVISTPYWHAEELLADGRGILVPFRDADAIAKAINRLLDNEAERHAIRKRAYLYGRQMIWPVVAQRYLESFKRARATGTTRTRVAIPALNQRPGDLPMLKLDHLKRLTDDTGILQHATYSVPNYNEGYTTDDNARALIVAVLVEELGGKTATEAPELATRYLAFLWHAFNPETGRFRNFLDYNRNWLEAVGSEDSHARALWGLGYVVGRSRRTGLWKLAGRLFEEALPAALRFANPRAWAFTILGIQEYLRRFYGDRTAQQARKKLADRLFKLYQKHRRDDWRWFEDRLTYANARLPQALMMAGKWTDRSEWVEAGLEALRWLVHVQLDEQGYFAPIGNDGFYVQGQQRPYFDQQPIEANATVSACLEAYRITNDAFWYREAQRAFDWFLGRNQLGLPLYDPSTGGCYDGLQPNGVNENQGAESTLAFLLSLLEMKLAEAYLPLQQKGVEPKTARSLQPAIPAGSVEV